MSDDKKTYNKVKDRLEGQRNCLKRFVQSPDGKEAVKYLEMKFAGRTIVPGDPYMTHARTGERSVVDYLLSLQQEE